MEPSTVSSCILTLYREFAAYTTRRLQDLGLSFGLIYFVIYVGKHPDCTPSELTKALHLDWGHSQRSLNKLAEDGLHSRSAAEKNHPGSAEGKIECRSGTVHYQYVSAEDP